MRFRSNFLRAFCSLLVVVVLAAIGLADTIRLKDGSLIKGHIVSFGSGKFVVEIGGGSRRRQLTFMASEIESINFDPPSGAPQLTKETNRTASYVIPSSKIVLPPIAVPTNVGGPSDPRPDPARSGSRMQPVSLNVRVLADNTANGWTNSGWVVKKGQKIRITGGGDVSLGKGQTSPPSGIPSLNDNTKLLKNVPTGALVAVIGDDNNDFIYVGAEREFTATRDGALFLGINEGSLDDNSGAFDVKIEVLPDTNN